MHHEHPLEHYYAELKRKALSQSKNLGIVLGSEFFLNKFGGHELLKGRDVRVINNAVDTTIYRPIPKTDARRLLGLNKDETLIAFAACIMSEQRKGLDKLSEAVNRIDNPRIKIVAVGNNIHHRSWPNVIEMGFKDTAESLCEVFSACDFFAMPSMQEGITMLMSRSYDAAATMPQLSVRT